MGGLGTAFIGPPDPPTRQPEEEFNQWHPKQKPEWNKDKAHLHIACQPRRQTRRPCLRRMTADIEPSHFCRTARAGHEHVVDPRNHGIGRNPCPTPQCAFNKVGRDKRRNKTESGNDQKPPQIPPTSHAMAAPKGRRVSGELGRDSIMGMRRRRCPESAETPCPKRWSRS